MESIAKIKQERANADGKRLSSGDTPSSGLFYFWLVASASNHAPSQSGPQHAEAGAGNTNWYNMPASIRNCS